VIWQNCLSLEEPASDLAELPAVPIIWQNCLFVDRVPVITKQDDCLSVEEHASDLAKFLPVPVIWQNCLSVELCASDLEELLVCGGACQKFGRIVCMWRSLPVIWQNCLCQ
jgi:hypothetical protein